MNKIYKVKKNAAGHSVACSEFAKGHTRKAVLGSLLIAGILGMASTANAQAQSGTLTYLEQARGLIDHDSNNYKKLEGSTLVKLKNELDRFRAGTFTSQHLHVAAMEELNENINANKADIKDLTVQTLGNHADVQELKSDIKDVVGIQNAIAEQADKNKNNIRNLAEAQLTGVEVMKELDKKSDENTQKLKNLQVVQEIAQRSIGSNTTEIKKNKESIAQNNDAINDLKKASSENTGSIAKNQDDITKNKADIKDLTVQTLGNHADVQELKSDIKDVVGIQNAIAEQADKNKADIAAHKKEADANFEELTKNQNALIEKDEAINRELEGFAAYNELQDQYAKKQTEAIDALNKASDENTRNIEDLNAYNELQDQYAKKQTEAIDALNKASSANTDRIATAELGIAENKKDAQIAKAQANENKDGIAKNQADIQLHDQKINNLGILHTMVSRAVGNNTQGVAANKADIAKNNESIEDLYEANNENVERIAQIDNNVFVNRLNIKELERKQENDIKDVVGMQNAIAEQADKNKNNIQDLAKAQLAGVEVMDELNKNVEKNKADADANFEELTKNQNTLIEKDKEHDKLITANKTAIDANKASADAKFAATADAITKNGNAITANAKSITDLGTKVDGFDGRVTALDTKVNGFDGRISALDTKVNAFDGRITALDSKVENGMAAQAALSGLFQPYSVGKFNATAALGGYGSKSAVAIGAGYRVNPNLAFKAGAAINTSGDKKGSYNIGVNYEF